MPEGEIAETEAADSNSDQFLHFVPDFVKHPPNLPVDSLSQNNAEMGWLDHAEDIDSRALTVEHDALQQPGSHGRVPRPIDSHLILLLDLITGMSEALREVAIVGQKEETFGLGV